ncbi:MAG: UvrD-helicase domain-containing protein [Planctomycetes bacterium]|nr:UvrD-helicase domain-containing protein [Planctomycetota bacterium]
MPDLTPSQQTALAFERNTVVSAGAGSGKTRVLVELFLKLLAAPYTSLPPAPAPAPAPTPERIVAITFTEKAAGEMRERIRATIDGRIASAADAATARWWSEARRRLPSAPIRTIHSFCAGLLRENAAEAGVDPQFTVLDERESSSLFQAAVWEVVVGGVRAGDARVQSLVEDFGLRRFADYSPDGVLDFVHRLHGEVSGAGVTLRDVTLVAPPLEPAVETALLRGLAARLASAVARFVELAATGTSDLQAAGAALRASWDRLAPQFAVLSPDSPQVLLRGLRELAQRAGYRGKGASLFREPATELKSLCGEQGELLEAFAEAKARPKAARILEVLREVDASYRARKQARAGLDFEDLQAGARALLRDGPSIRRRYKRAFDFLLVDEFQDTNELQREIVTLLAEEEGREAHVPSGAQASRLLAFAPRKLFVVGDPKQSIYGFRGADVGVFRDLAERVVASGGARVAFQENFRSTPWVVHFVNELAAKTVLPVEQGPGADEPHRVRFGPGHRLLARRDEVPWDGQVEAISVSGDSALAARVEEAAVLAERVLRLVDPADGVKVGDGDDRRPARFGDVAFLFRVLTDVKLYERELRRRHVPFYVVHGRGFFETQEVKDLLNLLAYLDNPLEQVPLAGFLRSPLVGLSDATLFRLAQARKGEAGLLDPPGPKRLPEEEARRLTFAREHVAEWSRLRDRIPLAELLARVVTECGYEAVLLSLFQGEQRLANVRKLLELARRFEKSGATLFRDFVRYLQHQVEEGTREPEFPLAAESANVVRLLSIHQAKGLEFPIVFLPDLGRKRQPPAGGVAFSPRLGLAASVPLGPLGASVRSPSARRIVEEAENRQAEEDRRLFYVGVTRARDRLVLLGNLGKAARTTWGGWVREFVGEPALQEAATTEGGVEVRFPVADRGDGQAGEGRVRVTVAGAPSTATGGSSPAEASEPTLAELWQEGPPSPTPEDMARARALLDRLEASSGGAAAGAARSSVADLAELATCERRHFYLCRLGLGEEEADEATGAAEPANAPAPGGGRLPARERGLLAHAVLASADLELYGVPLIQEIEERLAALAGRSVQGDAALEAVREDVVRFLWSDWAKRMRRARRRERELPFRLALALESGGRLFVDGVIDLLFEGADGEWCVLEYKSGRRRPETEERHRFQATLYALAARRALGIADVHAAIKYLGDRDEAPVDLATGGADLEAFERRLGVLGRALLRGEAAEEAWRQVQPATRCGELGCGFRARCGR